MKSVSQGQEVPLVVGDPSKVQEGHTITPSDEALLSMHDMGSYFPPTNQTNNIFQSDLSWDDWLSSGLTNEPEINMSQDCPPPNTSSMRCPSLDSNASSNPDQMLNCEWPANFLDDPQFHFSPPCAQGAVQQDIESCIPQLAQSTPYHSPTEEHPPNDPNQTQQSANIKKTVSPTKRKRGSQTKSETPAKEPAKKDVKTKLSTTQSRSAHSVIEHNYRKNLNVKMEQLRQVLSIADNSASNEDGEDGSEVEEKPTSSTKTRKSDVLSHAYDYVKRNEKEKKSMANENAFLKRRLVALEKLVKCEDCNLLKQMNMLQMGVGGNGNGVL